MNRVTVYTTEPCGYCRVAKALLAKRRIPYEEINLSRDPDGRFVALSRFEDVHAEALDWDRFRLDSLPLALEPAH